MIRRMLAALVAAVLTLLVCEGGLSLAGRTLRPGESGVDPEVRRRLLEAAASQGLYEVHPDPHVGYVLARNRDDLVLHEGTIRSDEWGLRRRAGPEPPEGAETFRIAVLGDSVAFGYGLDDDETLAHRLEQVLDGVRGPDAPPVVARTVAIPGWNARNAIRFTLDHLEELDPDLVLYVPVANDLSDTDGVLETGHRRLGPDPMAADPWLEVRTGGVLSFQRALKQRLGTRISDPGPALLQADLSAESRRRYGENLAFLNRLRTRLEPRGAPLVLLPYREGTYTTMLLARLERAGLGLPVIALLTRLPAEHTLGFDPHPDAETQVVLATWVAQALLERGLVDAGENRPLPEVPDEWAAVRAETYRAGRFQALAKALRQNNRATLRSRVDFRTGEGSSQIYGGLHSDGTAGPVLKLGLRRGEGPLLVRLEGLPEVPGQTVEVLGDGVLLGHLAVGPGEVGSRQWPLPTVSASVDESGEAGGEVLEVELRARDWSVGEIGGGRRVPRSMRPLLLTTDPTR